MVIGPKVIVHAENYRHYTNDLFDRFYRGLLDNIGLQSLYLTAAFNQLYNTSCTSVFKVGS